MPTKWFVKSRTLWINAAIGGLFATGIAVPDSVASGDAMQVLGGFATVGNGGIRLVTSQALGAAGKRVLKSRTVKLNVLLLLAAAVAVAAGNLAIAGVLGGIAIVNLLMRKATTKPVTLFPHPLRGRATY